MKDLPRWLHIPMGCAVNVVIINQLSSTKTFKEKCIEVPPETLNIKPPTKGEKWPFIDNLSWDAYMMYCFLVVPKEIFNLESDDEFFDLKNNIIQNFKFKKNDIQESFEENPLHHLIKLRNAVAHVNYEISDNYLLTMWNEKNNEINWKVEIKRSDMKAFLEEIANKYFMLYSQIKNDQRKTNGQKY